MDNRTKKIIADLCSSVNAMKAEIETLKKGPPTVVETQPICKTKA